MKKAHVVLLRRTHPELSQVEISALKAAFPGVQLQFTSTNPRDHLEHAAKCTEINATVVLLPKDVPIPVTAMKAGIPHIAIIEGRVFRLMEINPKYKPFPE